MTSSTVTNVQSYKYLGVIFDLKLSWQTHVTKVVASTTCWTQQLWCVSKTAGGLLLNRTHQLYNTVVVPAFTYALDIWYIPPFKISNAQKTSGAVGDTRLLQMIQGTAARYITGGTRGTAYNALKAHANIPPVDILFRKTQFRAVSRICALPHHHPLYPLAHKAAARFVKTHCLPLHFLFFTTGLKPDQTETIDPARQHPIYRPTMETVISANKEDALMLANSTHSATRYKVYCDRSSLEGGVGALAILYKGNREVKSLCLHLGPATKHTVYESELIGILLALYLLTKLTTKLLHTVIIGINNQQSKPAAYLLDKIHMVAKKFQEHQDHLQFKADFQLA